MEIRRRRLWTFAVSAGAVLVIGAAAASGLFQLVVQAAPGYRAQIERYVHDITGRPLRIGSVALTWRYYYPALDLAGVELLDGAGGAPLLRAERLRLGFALTRLVRGDFRPARLELHGLALDARIERDGRWRIDGFDTDDGASGAAALAHLDAFGELALLRCRLNVDDARGNLSGVFGITEFTLSRGLLGTEIEADVLLPAALGERALVQGSIDGDWREPASWSGRWAARLSGLVPAVWLRPHLARGATLSVADSETFVAGEVEDGRVAAMDLHVRLVGVTAQRSRHRAAFDRLDTRARIEFAADGWQADIKRFALESAHGSWPDAAATLRYRSGAGVPQLEGQFEFLRLADLAPWLQMARAPGALGAFDNAAGELRDVAFVTELAGEPRYSVRGTFAELALPAAGRGAGFSGAAGEFAADEYGGRALLARGPLQVQLPAVLVNGVAPFEALEGELEWRRRAAGWTVGMPRFRWTLSGTQGDGRFALVLPDQGGPELDLTAEFSAADVTAAKALMPRHWGSGLRSWLDRSILSGRVERAALVIKGPLDDFPFQKKPGTFSLDIEAAGILLAYQPDWPPVEDIGAALSFRGNSLTVTGRGGVIAGSPIKAVTAKFADFADAHLVIEGAVAGETARFYDFLGRSPLRDDLAGLLDNTAGRGPAAVDVHLDIPLRDARATRTRGRVALDGVELRYRGLDEPIRGITGTVAFSPSGIVAERLRGTLHGVPVAATMRARPDGSSLLEAGFEFTLDRAGKGLSGFVPAWLRGKLAGASAFRAELAIGADAPSPLMLHSDLAGMAVNLPPPFGKDAAAAAPLTVAVGGGGAELRVTAEYARGLGADLRFAGGGRQTRLRRGALRLGPGGPAEAPAQGLTVGGTLAEIDLAAWSRELEGSGLEQQAPLFREADVTVGRAAWGRYALHDTRYRWTPLDNGWELAASGGNFGELRWDAAARLVTARMSQLRLAVADTAGEDDGSPIEPAALPRLDLDIQRLALNEADLGRVQLATTRVDGGQKIRALNVGGGIVTLGGGGEWRRRGGRSSAALTLDFTTSDIAALLKAAGYARTLDAKSTRLKGELRWPPAAQGIDWQQGEGNVKVEFADGQLYTVNPGAGRVLGLFSFYALPRRLTLNFRDVVGKGLGFDRIDGDFRLAGGNAFTDNLSIAGPSLRMELRGRVGLAARDYDQSVTVYPDVSAGVTVGALALGGPVIGALALIAQELLNKPLDQVTQLSYRVTGSWDNPQVERAEETADPAKPRSGSPSQRP